MARGTRVFSFTASDLTDEEVRDVCESYWMDYICFPFDLPPQCNITELFIKHYGTDKDVEFVDC